MEKSAEAFRTISEVADALNTPTHVLRFWESRFTQIRPLKRAGGRRYYRPDDVALLAGIRKLLHDDGLTIRGVQKILKEKGVRHVAALGDGPGDVIEGTLAPPAVEDGSRAARRAARAARKAGSVAEAPMAEDVPTLPLGPAETVPLYPEPAKSSPAPAEEKAAPPSAEQDVLPAARLLRAMDALRAHEKRSELTAVYRRLTALRDRVAGPSRR